MLLLFVIAAFLSAALLFVVEPIFARMILPLLGGAPAVWNSCVVFYQVMLLAGYAYAHLLTTRVLAAGQLLIHAGLVAMAAMFLPIEIDPGLMPPPADNPVLWVFRLLLLTLGLPFFVVATTGPLVQRWFATTAHPAARNPYMLYAASNLGSLLALLAYPTLIEPSLTLHTQNVTWTFGYALFGLVTMVCGVLAWRAQAHARPRNPEPETTHPVPSTQHPAPVPISDHWPVRLRWLGLAFVPSSLMLSVTTFLATDVASMPLLWIGPLSLYLITFIIAFADRKIVSRAFVKRLLPGTAIVIVAFVLAQNTVPVGTALFWHLLAFFTLALGCHQELAASRPPATGLTEFYLWISAGGAIGGLFNTLVAPLVFVNPVEYPLVAIAGCLLLPTVEPWPSRTSQRVRAVVITLLPVVLMHVAIAAVRAQDDAISQEVAVRYLIIFLIPLLICYSLRKAPVRMGLALASLVFAGSFVRFDNRRPLYIERTFFGVHRVMFTGNERLLQNGTTNHGAQLVNPRLACEPLTYYSREGPVGQVIDAFTADSPAARIGVVGLGTATMAVYAKPGQSWTFYEINPAIDRIARDPSYFTFVRDCGPDVKTMLGDARLSLVREPDASFDLLVLDAFSSDAIPVHLMTQEAMSLYFAKLKPGGRIALHISNRYLELAPVVAALARAAGGVAAMQFHVPSAKQQALSAEITASRWAVVARRAADLGPIASDARWPLITALEGPLWTDDYSDVFNLMRWR